VKNFVRDLRTLLRWLNDEASKHDPAFSKWFEGILLNERGIMQYNFEASGVVMRIHSLCFFPFERFVDDDTVRGIMSLFEEHYDANGRNLFIPPLVLEAWRRNLESPRESCPEWEWEMERMRGGAVEKVFAIVLLTEHWGAFYIDMTKGTIDFGDSLNKPLPQDALRAIRRWLEFTGQGLQVINSACGKFDVPRQPLTSGSCAINAANTIERVFRPEIHRWNHSTSAYHRLRFFKLLTGYEKVRIFKSKRRYGNFS
jgi:hypothetical protein